MKIIYIISLVCITLDLSAALANPVDDGMDKVREPIVRPNAETVKSWLYNKPIILERTSLFKRDITEAIEPTKIQDLKHIDGSIFQNAVISNYGLATYSFSYPYKEKIQHYTANVKYVWKVSITGGEIERTPEKVVITGP